MWRILLKGIEENGRDIRVAIDLRLPADPPGAGQ
jgi:hypothetical protein